MKPSRLAMIAVLFTLAVTYVSCGPLPCVRDTGARCGVLAYDYTADSSLFPPQALVTMLIFSFVSGTLTWFLAAKGDPPAPIRFFSGVVLVMASLAAIAGFGGLLGIGAPFILPILWLAARHASKWARALWIALAGMCAAAGSWMIGIPLGTHADGSLALTTAAAVTALFIWTTSKKQHIHE